MRGVLILLLAALAQALAAPAATSAPAPTPAAAPTATAQAAQINYYSFAELAAEPNSLAKDFYLNELLEAKALAPHELAVLKKHIWRYAGKIAKNYEALVPPASKELTAEENPCYNYTPANIISAPFKCAKLRLGEINFVKKLKPAQLKKIIKKYEKSQPEFATMVEIYASKSPARTAISKGAGDLALKLYYQDYKLPDLPLGPLGQRSFLRSSLAYKFLNSALVDGTYPLLRKSLLNSAWPGKKISYDLAFAMGLNALLHNHRTTAKRYFLAAAAASIYKRPRDNALWFAYLAGRDEAVLRQVAASEDLNIYSLYARELLGIEGYEIIVPQPTAVLANEPISDALAQARWQIALKSASKEQLRELEQKYYARNTLGQYLAVHTRLHGFKHNIYPLPFAEYLQDASTDEKALIYALAMQESRFLPASVSTSYALGMMQFMPFVARHTAKADFGMEDFDVTKMFEPATALPFALAHVRTLKKGVNSPLFVAYAYNGGLGFTRRMLAKHEMFASVYGAQISALTPPDARQKRGRPEDLASGAKGVKRGSKRAGTGGKHQQLAREEFEPFLSMELVPYQESRLYGKKVLANYYVYKNLLGERVSMRELFAALNKRADAELVEKSKEQK